MSIVTYKYIKGISMIPPMPFKAYITEISGTKLVELSEGLDNQVIPEDSDIIELISRYFPELQFQMALIALSNEIRKEFARRYKRNGII